MRDIPALILRDPPLRMVAGGVLLFGTIAASVGVHQSLVAVRVFGIGDAGYALILLLAMTVSVSSSIAMGIATDRGPCRRHMALLAAGASVLGAGTVAATGHPLAFLLAHVVLIPVGGTIFGQVFAAARLASARHDAGTQAGILAGLRALFAIPFVVVLPIWGLAFAEDVPLLAIYPVVTAVAGLNLLLLWRAWPPDAQAPWVDAKSGLGLAASLRELSAAPVILRVALIGAIHSGGAVVGIILGLLFAEVGRGTGDVGLFFGLFVAVEVLGTLAVGSLARHWPRLPLIAAGVGLYASFLALMPFLAGTPWIWALVLPAGLGGGLIYTLAIGYLQDLLAQRPGAGGSLIAVQRVAAEGLTTAIYGFGAAVQGYATVAVLAAAATILAMAAILWLDRPRPGP